MSKEQVWGSLLVVLNDKIGLPIKAQKVEKLATLNTYAFTINLVPHVFGDYCFAGHKYKYIKRIHQKALSDAHLRKGITKTPINSTQPGQSTIEE